MPEVNIWDVTAAEKASQQPVVCGYLRDVESVYSLGEQLGKGGFATVVAATHRETGASFACKVIEKRLELPGVSATKQAQHVDNIRREVEILTKLRGCGSVVHLEGAYEDDSNVYIVMEACTGGELWHGVGSRHYSERTVASYMRAVLRTLVQCHKMGILHRDVKPGNFMLLNKTVRAPLKAIDFGLAVFYSPDELPRTDLGLDGTAWFMAPEVLSSEVYPVSDVWSAGVMAYQLLSGYLPFDDHQHPRNAALSLIWRSILTHEPSFSRACWADISEDAKAFIRALLVKDPSRRPTATEALQHPWLRSGTSAERDQGAPLPTTVVARIQQFAQRDMLQRTILELIANELLLRLAAAPQQSLSTLSEMEAVEPHEATDKLGALGSPSARFSPATGSDGAPPLGGSVRGGGLSAGGITSPPVGGSARAGTEIAKQVLMLRRRLTQEGSARGRSIFQRQLSSGIRQVEHQRKAGRLALDTSVHGGSGSGKRNFAALRVDSAAGGAGAADAAKVRRATLDFSPAQPAAEAPVQGPPEGRKSVSELTRALSHTSAASVRTGDSAPGPPGLASRADTSQELPSAPSLQALLGTVETSGRLSKDSDRPPPPSEEAQGKGRSLARGLMDSLAERPDAERRPEGASGPWAISTDRATAAPAGGAPAAPGGVYTPGSMPGIMRASGTSGSHSRSDMAPPAKADAAVTPKSLKEKLERVHQGAQVPPPPEPEPSRRGSGLSQHCLEEASQHDPQLQRFLTHFFDQDGRLAEMRSLLRSLRLHRQENVGGDEFKAALVDLGYQLSEDEAAALLRYISSDERVTRQKFLASQLDWRKLQENHREMWLECVRDTFEALDSDADGIVSADAFVGMLRGKLPDPDIDLAVEEAMLKVCAEDAGVNFEEFLGLVQSESYLDLAAMDL